MMMILKDTYTISVTIQRPLEVPGVNPFWDGIRDRTGCDEVVSEVKAAIEGKFPGVQVRLQKFDHQH